MRRNVRDKKFTFRKIYSFIVVYKFQLYVIFSLCIGLVLLFSNITLWQRLNQPIPETPVALQRTMEYQMKINKELWSNKTEAINILTSHIEEISGLQIKPSQFEVNARVQNNISIKNCTNSPDISIRLRQYIYGPKMYSTTLDAKINVDHDVKFGEFFPIQPAKKYAKNSVQKIEKDIHPCDYKYSKVTRITDKPKGYIFHSCSNVAEFFPDFLPTDAELMQRRVGYTYDEYWLVYSYSGYLDNLFDLEDRNKFFVHDMNRNKGDNTDSKDNNLLYKFKMEITLQYESYKDFWKDYATPVKGEFSLRLWSSYDGHGPFDPILVKEADYWYSLLLLRFGSEDDLPCPRFPQLKFLNIL